MKRSNDKELPWWLSGEGSANAGDGVLTPDLGISHIQWRN